MDGGRNMTESRGSSLRRGAVTRITMHNFMTYDHVTVRPKPGLNIIIGPNGTGKSSIAAALCIGFGADLKTLGRGESLADYVRKRGFVETDPSTPSKSPPQGRKKDTYVEVEVVNAGESARGAKKGRPGHTTIRRTFSARNNASKWTVNGRNTPSQEVKALFEGIGIDFANPCMFLPQDKVKSFAQLTPQERLRHTLRIISLPTVTVNGVTGSIPSLMVELAEGKSRFDTEKENADNMRARLEKIEQELRQVERQLERNAEREVLVAQKRNLEIWLPWCIFFKLQDDIDEQKQEQKEIQDILRAMKTHIEKDEKEVETFRKREQQADTRLSTLKKKNATLEKTVREDTNRISAKRKELESHMEQKSNLESILQNLDATKTGFESQIHSIDEQIANSRAEDEIVAEQEALVKENKERREKNQKLEEDARKADVAYKNTKRKVEAEERRGTSAADGQKKLIQRARQILGHNVDEAMRVLDWIKENRNDFDDPESLLRGPVFMQVKVENELYARFFMDNTQRRVFTAFVATSEKDRGLLVNQTKLLILYTSFETTRRRDFTKAELNAASIDLYLDEAVQAPPHIKTALNNMTKMDRIGCSSRDDETRVNRILDGTRMRTVYMKSSKINAQRSKYSQRDVSVYVTAVPEERPFFMPEFGTATTNNGHESRLAELKRQLSEEKRVLDQLNAKVKEQEKDLQRRSANITRLSKELSDIAELRSKKHDLETQLRALQGPESLQREIDSQRDEIRSVAGALLEMEAALLEKHRELIGTAQDLVGPDIEYACWRSVLRYLEADLAEKNADMSAHVERKREIDEILAKLKEEHKSALKRAQETTKLTDEMQLLFRDLPQNESAVRNEIDRLAREIMSFFIDPELEQLQAHLSSEKTALQDTLARVDTDLREERKNIEAIENAVIPVVKEKVQEISSYFREYFELIECNGEVTLTPEALEKRDYANLGIDVNVQFRDGEQLHALNQHRQSGGERAVTTAFYLITLQHFTRVPFHLVDEINQGMDRTNDRKVFESLINIMTRASDSQYFVITPKLLPNLPLRRPNLSVHCVLNGPDVQFGEDELDLDEWVARKRRRSAGVA